MMATRNRKPATRPAAPVVQAPVLPSLSDVILQAVRDLSGPYRPGELPVIYGRVRESFRSLTLGEFHDRMRSLHADGRLRLSPWTRALAAVNTRDNVIFLDGECMYWVQLPSA